MTLDPQSFFNGLHTQHLSKMEKTVKKYNSFTEQERDDIVYWRNLSGDKKLEILEIIRAKYWALKNERSPGFQRVYRVIEQARR